MGSCSAALCFTSYFLCNNLCSKQIWIYMWFSIHSYITSQRKFFCHINYFNLSCPGSVCFVRGECENLVRLLTQLDFGAFDNTQLTSTGIVSPTWTLSGSYLHLQKWSCFCCRWIKYVFFLIKFILGNCPVRSTAICRESRPWRVLYEGELQRGRHHRSHTLQHKVSKMNR